MARLMMSIALVAVTAGPALGQAQAPTTKAPPPARTPSAVIGPPTGLPRVGTPPPRIIVPPGRQEIDPGTGAPTTAPPSDPVTPPSLVPPGTPRSEVDPTTGAPVDPRTR